MANDLDYRNRDLAGRRNRHQAKKRSNTDPFMIPEEEFVKTFRLGKKAVRDLIDELTPFIPKPRRSDGLSVETKIMIALAFYASGSHQMLVGQSALHSVSQISVSRSVGQVTEALNNIFDKYVKWPTRRNERDDIKAKFYQKFGFPGVVGCIHGTHVAIIRPHSHTKFYNKVSFHSLNVMIICDADLNILCVDASNPGSTDDSNVWLNHPLSQYLNDLICNGEQGFLLGHSGYVLSKSLMTPIPNTIEGTPQHCFNMTHRTASNTIQRCIGLLKARFKCLLAARALHYSPEAAEKIVNACCVLHNIANSTEAPVDPLTPEEDRAENLRLKQDNHNLRAEWDSTVESNNSQNQCVNLDLLEGKALQEALINSLWRN